MYGAGLRPLLSWEGCSKHSASSVPSPRRLTAWLLGREDYVALLESGGGLPGRSRYTVVAAGVEDEASSNDPVNAYNALAGFLHRLRCSSLPCRDMAVILVSYEAVAGAEPWLADRLGRHEWPVAEAFKPSMLVVYDHAAERVVVCPEDAAIGSAEPPQGFRARGVEYATPPDQYMEWVRELRRAIEDGEVFQVVVSRLVRAGFTGDPYAAYIRLAELNPSPYMYYIRMGDRFLLGTSPELLVKLSDGRLETHPIAGTRPRGRGERDIELEEEMLGDEKELAEHLMLVDLARNDLGRVAAPGTVRVTALMDVEKYSHVQHIVSRVEAQAAPGTTYHKALKAVHPAGTVSGAPKPRAMELIAGLEEEPRGPYAGAVGLAASHAGETAIVIRSAWGYMDGVVESRAGAGIVYDSKPERELEETRHKLRAVMKALGVTEGY